MNVVAIIPARGNSKRLTRKNLYSLWGKPLLYWAIRACNESAFDVVPWVSSEDAEIRQVAAEFGARVHIRDASLSDDETPKQAVIRSVAAHIRESSAAPDLVISLQPNSPQIRGQHLDEGINTLLKYGRDEIFSVNSNLMQNAAFRIFRFDYVFQLDLSTNCGVYVCDLMDVHTLEDILVLENAG